MGIFTKDKKGGMADAIRCDESDYLIYKWHPNKYAEGELKRETAIRTSSILRVKTGEVAVFVYKQKDGQLEDYIVGPFEETIKTKNFPVLSSIIGLWYEGDTPFQAEVFFINISQVVQFRFGIPYFNVVDPRFPDFEVPVAVRGTVTFGIADYKRFVKCHQLVTVTLDNIKKKVSDTVCRYIKDAVAGAPTENNIPVISIESKLDLINEKAEMKIKNRVDELFGIKVSGVDISDIEIDKESIAYKELRQVTKDLAKRQAEADILNYEEQLRIQREESQYAQHKGTQSSNISAYQLEKQAEVGIAGAESLGKMGANGAGGVNLGGSGNGEVGFNPAAMMVGMSVGSAVGQNIAGTLNGAMSGAPSQMTPPPVPAVMYHVAVNGQPAGPFDINTLRQMAAGEAFNGESLVWKDGMSEWAKAEDVEDLKNIFPSSIPPIPPIG